jgi:hypothetical protein
VAELTPAEKLHGIGTLAVAQQVIVAERFGLSDVDGRPVLLLDQLDCSEAAS